MGNSGGACFKAVANQDAAALSSAIKGVAVLQIQAPRPSPSSGGRTSDDMVNLLQAAVLAGGCPTCVGLILKAVREMDGSSTVKCSFVNTKDPLDKMRTPLLQLANVGNTEGVRVLLQYSADPKMQDNLGLTALALAVMKAGTEIRLNTGTIEVLLPVSEIEHRDGLGRTALTHALLARENQAVLAGLLMKHGARLDTKCNRGKTVLMQAIKESDPLLLAKLLKEMATSLEGEEGKRVSLNPPFKTMADFINNTDDSGGSALWEAALRKGTKMVEVLLEFKGDVNVKGPAHWSLLHLAAETDNASLAALYLHAYPIADLNPRDENGMTPCHLARFRGSASVLALLETCKCNMAIIDSRGFSPQALMELPRTTLLGQKLTDPVAVEEAAIKKREDKRDTWLQDMEEHGHGHKGMTDAKDQRHALKQMQGIDRKSVV